MAWNARYLFDTVTEQFFRISNPISWLPGGMDPVLMRLSMFTISGMSLGFVVMCDMATDAVWRKRMLLTMALTGAAIAVFGIVLKFGGVSLMEVFWEDYEVTPTNFALYLYHGNAAAYLNLTWPLALAFLLARLQAKPIIIKAQMLWAFCTGAILTGCMINGSKAGVALSTIMVIIFTGWRWSVLRQRVEPGQPIFFNNLAPDVRKAYIGIAVFLFLSFLIFIVASSTQTKSGWARWANIGNEQHTSVQPRLLSYGISGNIAAHAGWFGFGPDTFSVVFPYYAREHSAEELGGAWIYAHEDYLQALIEWGWLGGALWGLFLFGGLARGWWTFHERSNFANSEQRLLLFACCIALTGMAVHATFDFPFQIPSLELYSLALLAICWNSHYLRIEADVPAPVLHKKHRREA